MKVVGTRKPEVEFGSPMPKSSDLSHFRMSSSFWNGLVLMDQNVAPVARIAADVDGLGEHFTIRAINCFHCRLVAEPCNLHLVEAHAFDHAGIVGCEERLHFRPVFFAMSSRNGCQTCFRLLLDSVEMMPKLIVFGRLQRPGAATISAERGQAMIERLNIVWLHAI